MDDACQAKSSSESPMIVPGDGNPGIEQVDTPFPGLGTELRNLGGILKLAACQLVEAKVKGRIMRIEAIVAFFLFHERYGYGSSPFDTAAVQIYTFKHLCILYGIVFSLGFVHLYFDFAVTLLDDNFAAIEVKSGVLRDAFLCHHCHGSHEQE